ncbi:MAG: PAS domain-containing protein, partial [Verrucomicrobiota bacterium]
MSQNLFTSIGMIACLMGTGVLWHLLRKLRAQEKEMATLRASEELMRFMMEADQTGYWELPLADHTMRRSLTHDRIFGYASLLPTWTCTDFLNHIFVDDREAAKRTFQKAIEAKHDCYFQCRIVRRDGMMRWIEVRSRRLNGEAGTLDRVIGLVRDITAYKEAEKLVSQTEQFKAAVLDAIPAEIAVLDQAGKILAVNQPWLQFGYENQSHPERTAGVGINYLDVARDSACSGDVLAGEAVEGIEAVLSGRQREFHLEYPCDAPAQQRWFLMHVVAAPTEMGGAIVTHSDITARKQAQEALSKSQKVLELAIEGGQFGIWDWDLMTDKLLWSERRKAIAGLPPETETTPALFLSTIHPEDRAHVQRAVEHALKTKKASEM